MQEIGLWQYNGLLVPKVQKGPKGVVHLYRGAYSVKPDIGPCFCARFDIIFKVLRNRCVHTSIQLHYPLNIVGGTNHSSHRKSMTVSKVKVTTRVMGQSERAFFAQDIQRVNWNPLLRLETCQEQLDYFITTINDLFESHFPKKEVFRHESDKPWVTDSFKKLVRKRQYAYLNDNQDEYKLIRNKVNRMRTRLRSEYYKNKVSQLKDSNVKQWWKKVNELAGKSDSSSKQLQGLCNDICDGDEVQFANKINEFFKSVGSSLVPIESINEYSEYEIEVNEIPEEYIISLEQTQKQLAKLNVCKAIGPDMIPTWILRDFCEYLAIPVCAIYNSLIREGHVPQIWKSADVSALPKKTPPKTIENDLRPISLTPILCKDLETFVVEWTWVFIRDKLDKRQYGSLKGSSTTHALS